MALPTETPSTASGQATATATPSSGATATPSSGATNTSGSNGAPPVESDATLASGASNVRTSTSFGGAGGGMILPTRTPAPAADTLDARDQAELERTMAQYTNEAEDAGDGNPNPHGRRRSPSSSSSSSLEELSASAVRASTGSGQREHSTSIQEAPNSVAPSIQEATNGAATTTTTPSAATTSSGATPSSAVTTSSSAATTTGSSSTPAAGTNIATLHADAPDLSAVIDALHVKNDPDILVNKGTYTTKDGKDKIFYRPCWRCYSAGKTCVLKTGSKASSCVRCGHLFCNADGNLPQRCSEEEAWQREKALVETNIVGGVWRPYDVELFTRPSGQPTWTEVAAKQNFGQGAPVLDTLSKVEAAEAYLRFVATEAHEDLVFRLDLECKRFRSKEEEKKRKAGDSQWLIEGRPEYDARTVMSEQRKEIIKREQKAAEEKAKRDAAAGERASKRTRKSKPRATLDAADMQFQELRRQSSTSASPPPEAGPSGSASTSASRSGRSASASTSGSRPASASGSARPRDA